MKFVWPWELTDWFSWFAHNCTTAYNVQGTNFIVQGHYFRLFGIEWTTEGK